MFLTKLTAACAVLLWVGAIGAGTGLLAFQTLTDHTARSPRAALAGGDKAKPEKQGVEDEKAARRRSFENLQKLMLAMHEYHDVNNHLPPAAIYDKNGKALLSWRVLILPYIGEEELFKQFRLNEPWDSKHNKALLAKMPKRFAPPVRGKTKAKDATFYQVFAGKDTVFEGPDGVTILQIVDGTSNTIAIAEAAEAVPWTKPADLAFDAKKPLPKLGGLFEHGFHAATADGAVHWLRKDFDEQTMRHAITRNGGEVLDFDTLKSDK